MEDGLPPAGVTTLPRERAAATLAALLKAPILTVAGEPLTGRDLVAAGTVSGRWSALEADLELGLVLRAASPPPRAEVDAALRAFRYARRLTSAQDVRAWLTRRELALADLREAIARDLARAGRRGAATSRSAAREDALAALPAEAVLSGALRDCGWWLADRLLAARDGDGAGAGAGATGVAEQRLDTLVAREAQLLVLAGLRDPEPDHDRRARLARLLAADAAFAQQCAQAAGHDALARCVDAHRLAWIAFELEGLRAATAGVAAEAAMQLREDGLALDEVARAAGLAVQRRRLRLEDADGALRTSLAAAAAGLVVGPVAAGGGHEVWVVKRRAQPDVHDREVAVRAAHAVLAAEADRRRAGRVRWHDRD